MTQTSMMEHQLDPPCFRARAVLFDLDETIVTRSGGGGNPFIGVLVAMVAERQGVSAEEAA